MSNHHRSLMRKTGKRVKASLLFLLVLLMVLGGGLWLANQGMRHPEGVATVKNLMHETRYSWLAWRLFLYCAVGWGLWKVWHAPGFRAEYRRPVLRMAGMSVLFVLVCEYSIFSGVGG